MPRKVTAERLEQIEATATEPYQERLDAAERALRETLTPDQQLAFLAYEAASAERLVAVQWQTAEAYAR